MFEEITEKMKSIGIVPVVTINDAEDTAKICDALFEGGLRAAEITFRTDDAEDAIRTASERFPEMLIGAGTVLSCEIAEHAIDAGAKFIVSPGFDQEVVSYCITHGIAVYPGIGTPTEIISAIRVGLNSVKLFPAEQSGGTGYLKAISAAFPGVSFMPTGGINEGNAGDYLMLPQVFCVGGSWMVKKEYIESKDFARIEMLTKSAAETVKKCRGM